jgi:predicted transcriptional regulator
VKEAVMNTYVKFHNGSTARKILLEHGLVYNSSKYDINKMNLTKKGKDYLKAIIAELVMYNS